jgi:prolyl oligopeptidase
MDIDDRPTIAAPDDDPYIWLEEIEGERALDFVARQSRLTLDRFGSAAFERDRDTLAAIYDRPDNIPYVTRRGGLLYNLWKDADHPRGLWRRTTPEEYRKGEPQWETLLDVDALATAQGEDWLLAPWTATLPGSSPRAILSLSRGGSDAVTLREFDMDAKDFVADGFVLPEAKGGATWLDGDTLLLSSAYGEGMATTSGYARTIRLWRRGQDIDKAPVIFEARSRDHMAVYAFVDRTVSPLRVGFIEKLDFFNHHVWFGDATGPRVKLDVPSDTWIESHQDWLVVKLRTEWTIDGRTFAPDVVLSISLSAFLAGSHDFTIVFAPGPRRSLQGFFWAADRFILSILDELRPVFEVCTPSADGWTRTTLPGLPEIGVIHVNRLDWHETESNGDLHVDMQDPLTPPALALIEGVGSPTILKQQQPTFTTDGLVIRRHEAISIDGERIPYVQTGPAQETGEAPVYMTGYGGFGMPELPYYSAALGKMWLEHGGTCIRANIRGGGEFGTRWHDAGRYAGKRLTHDDFAAVAADLVKRGITRPERIAAEGGSNGGILITNMLVRYPERFGALFCTIPLIDMRRYTKLLAGASWIAEYGDPDKSDEWAWLQTYSAYHLAKPGQAYPPILIATTRRDDRVHPGHARKMTAKLQAMGYEAYLYEPAAGGHGYGKDNKERAAFIALGHTFLRDKIGWSDTDI